MTERGITDPDELGRPVAAPTEAARETYLRDGYVRVPGAFSESAAEVMAGRIWDQLEHRTEIRRHRPSTWSEEDLGSADARLTLKGLRRSDALAEIGSARLTAALDVIMGIDGWKRPRDWGSPLITFPTTGPWTVPAKRWHLDGAVTLEGSPPFVRLFAYLLPARPSGGGTLIVAGSQRLTERLALELGDGTAKALRPAMRTHPWLGRLMRDQGTAEERIRDFLNVGWHGDEFDLRVIELTGEPGDVIIWHPHAIHSAAPNVRATPRLMVTATLRTRPPHVGSVPTSPGLEQSGLDAGTRWTGGRPPAIVT